MYETYDIIVEVVNNLLHKLKRILYCNIVSLY